jgi:uncharacterized protein YlaI
MLIRTIVREKTEVSSNPSPELSDTQFIFKEETVSELRMYECDSCKAREEVPVGEFDLGSKPQKSAPKPDGWHLLYLPTGHNDKKLHLCDACMHKIFPGQPPSERGDEQAAKGGSSG